MPPHIILVLGQVASAEFILPVLNEFDEDGITYTIFANEVSARWLAVRSRTVELWSDDPGAALTSFKEKIEGACLLVTSLSYKDEELVALKWAAARNIKSLGILDNWYDMDKRLPVDDAAKRYPDHIAVIDKYATEKLNSHGLDLLLHIVGYPPLEDLPVLPPADKNKILFIDQPISAHPDLSPGYTEQDAWTLLQQACGDKEVAFAPHPASIWSPGGGVKIEQDTLAALNGYGTIAGMYSTVLLQAYLCGRRVLSIQPGRPVLDKFILSKRGILPALHNDIDIVRALDGPVLPMNDEFMAGLRGGARRFAALVKELAEK